MQDLIDAVEAAFTEAGVTHGVYDETLMLDILTGAGYPEFKVKAFPVIIRHPSHSGILNLASADYDNWVSAHADHYHVVSIPKE